MQIGKLLFFVDRCCHVHAFRLSEGKWSQHGSVDLFPTLNENPELRFVAHAFLDGQYLAYIASADDSKEIRAIDLRNLTAPPRVLLSF